MDYEQLQQIAADAAYLRQSAGWTAERVGRYLKQKYDIDAVQLVQLLQESRPPAPQGEQFDTPGIAATAVEHFGKGAALGWGDRLGGLYDAIGAIQSTMTQPGSLQDRLKAAGPAADQAYQSGVQEQQGYGAASAQAHPNVAKVARMAGVMAPFAAVGGAPAAVEGTAASPFLSTTARIAGGAGALGGVESASRIPEGATPGQVAGQIGKDVGLNAAFAGLIPITARYGLNAVFKPGFTVAEEALGQTGGAQAIRTAGQRIFARTGLRPTLAEAANEATRISAAKAGGIVPGALRQVESPGTLKLRGMIRRFPQARAQAQAYALMRVREAEHALTTAASVQQKAAIQTMLEQRRAFLMQTQRLARSGSAGGGGGAAEELAGATGTSKAYIGSRAAKNFAQWFGADFEAGLHAIEQAERAGQAAGGLTAGFGGASQARRRGLFDIPGFQPPEQPEQ